jgi:hypothetical protein
MVKYLSFHKFFFFFLPFKMLFFNVNGKVKMSHTPCFIKHTANLENVPRKLKRKENLYVSLFWGFLVVLCKIM